MEIEINESDLQHLGGVVEPIVNNVEQKVEIVNQKPAPKKRKTKKQLALEAEAARIAEEEANLNKPETQEPINNEFELKDHTDDFSEEVKKEIPVTGVVVDEPRSKPVPMKFTKAELEPYAAKVYTERDLINLKTKIGMYYSKFPELVDLVPKPKLLDKSQDGPALEYFLQKLKNTLNYKCTSTFVEDNFMYLVQAIEDLMNQFNFIDIRGYKKHTEEQFGDMINKALAEISIDYFDVFESCGTPVARLIFALTSSMYQTYKANQQEKKTGERLTEKVFNKYKDLLEPH